MEYKDKPIEELKLLTAANTSENISQGTMLETGVDISKFVTFRHNRSVDNLHRSNDGTPYNEIANAESKRNNSTDRSVPMLVINQGESLSEKNQRLPIMRPRMIKKKILNGAMQNWLVNKVKDKKLTEEE